MFHCRKYCQLQGHMGRASSEDSLGLELMTCISTSSSKQPHTQVQKVRQADSEIDGAVKACFSQESRYCYKRVTDMLNPHRKQRGCCRSCTGCLPGPTQTASSTNRCLFSCEIYTFTLKWPNMTTNEENYAKGVINLLHL